VVGHQWFWEISTPRVPAGTTVAFRVTSADVNHGFAIYDADLHVVAQTQAMPGYQNVLRVRFAKPGSYRVLCLEYCGIVHHGMAASLEVVASAGGES
jgi:cytochrome c oxidase subunit 2